MNPLNKLNKRINKTNSFLCVGLDSDISRLPKKFLSQKYPQFEFNRWIIEQTHPFVCAYKPNFAFYEARGERGWSELAMTASYIKNEHPDIFLIADAKRADIGSTNEGYVTAIFDELGFDAVTLNPYLGKEALEPFLSRKDKVSIILCKTSNPGSGEIQDLMVDGKPLWQYLAKQVAEKWSKLDNCMLVVGATYPHELKKIRQIVGEMPLLVPGVGEQGGDLQAVLKMGVNQQGKGLVINSSRGVIFADDPGAEAKKLSNEMCQIMSSQNIKNFQLKQLDRTIAVGLIISADNKLLLGKKMAGGVYPNCWHLPGGGVKKDETVEQALVRETWEETGIDLHKLKVTIKLIDDKGRGEHLKKMKNGQQVLAKMKFLVFEVVLPLSASQIKVEPGDDLQELSWFLFKDLDKIKHTPPSIELFKRLGKF